MHTLTLNSDWTQRCVVDSTQLPWQPSPSAQVHRKLLERNGGEVARATSIVRYEPGATFKAHQHELGEEILVLEGIFSDDTGHYGPGTYIKNPPGSSHSPFSELGCTLFVALRGLCSAPGQSAGGTLSTSSLFEAEPPRRGMAA